MADNTILLKIHVHVYMYSLTRAGTEHPDLFICIFYVHVCACAETIHMNRYCNTMVINTLYM